MIHVRLHISDTNLPELLHGNFSITITVKQFEGLFQAINVLHCYLSVRTESLRSLGHVVSFTIVFSPLAGLCNGKNTMPATALTTTGVWGWPGPVELTHRKLSLLGDQPVVTYNTVL